MRPIAPLCAVALALLCGAAPAIARTLERTVPPVGPGDRRVVYPVPPRPGPPRLLPPEPVQPPDAHGIRSAATVRASLDGSILTVDCSQTYTNDGHQQQEIQVLLPIPADAVVSDGSLLADGREYRADVLPAEQARAIYEDIVRRRRDPALLEMAGRGLIRLSAFPIPAGGSRTVSFRYHQSLAPHAGRQRVKIPLASVCGLDRPGAIDLTLRVDGTTPLAQITSPSHDVDIERTGATAARVRYHAAQADPHETLDLGVVRDARDIGIDVRTARGEGEDDYFLLSLSPGWQLLRQRARAPQTAVFALDTSGSMQGEKFAQARAALHRFLDDLHADDRFNLVAFASGVETFASRGPVLATAAARRDARAWVDGLSAGGGTNIGDALRVVLAREWDASLVLFLTDGRATVGETRREGLLQRAADAPRGARFYAFGVGDDVDADLLDDLAQDGHGSVTYVRPGQDADDAVTTLRRRVERPCVRDVSLRVEGVRVREVYPAGALDLFADEPLLVAGRMPAHAGRAMVRLTGTAANGAPLRASWEIDFADRDARSTSVPVLWASRKAASLLATLRREGRSPATLDELRELARRYGILTREVALLAREDEAVAMAPQSMRGSVTVKSTASRTSIDSKALKTLPADTFKEAVAIKPGIVGSSGRQHVRGGHGGDLASQVNGPLPAVPLNANTSLAVALPPSDAIDLSASRWDLARSTSAAEATKQSGARDHATRAGHTFRLVGAVWTDETLATQPPPTRTLRVRNYRHPYFALIARDARVAQWFALGERVRVRLGDVELAIAPDAPEQVDAADLAAVEKALVEDAKR